METNPRLFRSLFRHVRPRFAFSLLLLCAAPLSAVEPSPLDAAHAHNDYYHDRPLLDALSHGFCSVEADVFLVDSDLLIAHSQSELVKGNTLQSLYLDPLMERVRKHGGRVYADGPTLTLLVDFKSSGPDTYRALRQQLTPYHAMLTSVDDGAITERAVQIIISGNRSIELIAADNPRYVFVDGRLPDLDKEPTPKLMPLISDRWSSHFRWRGEGEITPAEKEKLSSIVRKCHDRRQRLRFWATPDRPSVWKLLHDANVDLINTDDLPGLAAFLCEQEKTGPEKTGPEKKDK